MFSLPNKVRADIFTTIVKEGGQRGLYAMEQQQEIVWLKGELEKKEEEIKAQQEKIDRAIEDDKSQKLINSYKDERARLVQEKRFFLEHLTHLQAQLAGQAGEVLAAAP